MLAELLLVGALAASQPEPGFGGAPAVPRAVPHADPSPARPPASAGACMVKDERGAWVDCSVVLDRGAPDAADAAAEREAEEARAAAQRLVAGMSDSPLAPAQGTAKAGVNQLTRIEEELKKVGRSADEFPLAALRRDVERMDLQIAAMEGRGATLGQRGPLLDQREDLYAALQQVETIALSRMSGCAARRGVNLEVRPYRMTAAGPVALTQEELLAALPAIDPPGCERFILVDQTLVDRVLRWRAAKRELATKKFGFHEIDRRRSLEKEIVQLKRELDEDAAPRIIVPGAQGL